MMVCVWLTQVRTNTLLNTEKCQRMMQTGGVMLGSTGMAMIVKYAMHHASAVTEAQPLTVQHVLLKTSS